MIGFIGLGRMGRPMARHLVASGAAVLGWDFQSSAMAAAVNDGVTPSSGVRDIVLGCDRVVLCLPGPAESKELIEGDEGLLKHLAPGSLVIETGTIGRDHAIRWSSAFARNGVDYVDAPISGGEAGAENGSLSIYVGGPATAFERARQILEIFGNRVEHVGPPGAGATVKLINQGIYLTYCVSLAEACATATAAGIAPERLIDLLGSSVSAQPLSTDWHVRLSTGDRTPGFSVERAAKDVKLFREMEAATGGNGPLSAALEGMLRKAVENGLGPMDISVLADKHLRAANEMSST